MSNYKLEVLHVTKFDGNNYRQWKFQMKCVLRARGVYEVASGATLKPEGVLVESLITWNKLDAIAVFTLTSTMEFAQITLVENCESSKQILDKLDSIYEQKSELNKMILRKNFYQYKMDSSDSMARHIAKVDNLAWQIRDCGEILSDTAVITTILGSLSSKYQNIRQARFCLAEEKQMIANLTGRLLDDEANLISVEEIESARLLQHQFQSEINKSITQRKIIVASRR